MKTQYNTATSLDGFIATGDDSLECLFPLEDVVPVHAAMCVASGSRSIWVVGGGDLAGQFHDAVVRGG
jgi:dihydrofolate reductase